MSKVFFISDLHFGHKNIINFSPQRAKFKTIEHHNETLVNNINSKVTDKDTLWVLGDICFGKENVKYFHRLNGIKRVVLGNHDYPIPGFYGDIKTFGVAEYRGCILSHVPVHPQQKNRYYANIHGHLHNDDYVKKPIIDITGIPYGEIKDKWYRNVNADSLNLFPIEWSEMQSMYM